jgi:signal peptidase I
MRLSWLGLAGAAIAVAALVLFAIRRRYALVTVRGQSMTPTLRDGERVLVRRGIRPAAGDLVVFRSPVTSDVAHLVKRVAALAGDAVPEPLQAAVPFDRVPPGQLLVRGDAATTQDSRHFGAISSASVLGVVRRRRQ